MREVFRYRLLGVKEEINFGNLCSSQIVSKISKTFRSH